MNSDKSIKIGISFDPYKNSYGRYGVNKFNKLKQHGYDAVDYNISDTNTELYCLNESDLKQKIASEKKSAALANIQISQLHGPFRYPPQDATHEEREERLEKMKKSVIISSLLGCKHLVIHPIMPYGTRDLLIDRAEDTWNLNLEFFSELVTFAEQYGVTICLENMPMLNFSMSKPEQILKFVQTVNHRNLKVCLDTGHVAVFPELSLEDEVRRLSNSLKVLHIHDNLGDKDSHLYPGEGILNWSGFKKALNEIGFDGVLSLETGPSEALDDQHFESESTNLYRLFKNLILENKQ